MHPFVLASGSCASGGGKAYYFNDSMVPIDDDHNMLWWHNFTVPANGSIRGNGANDGDVLTSGAKAVKSVIISNHADNSKLVQTVEIRATWF